MRIKFKLRTKFKAMNSIGNIFKTKLALGLFLITTNLCYSQTVKTVGTSGDYPTLSSAFNAVNSGSLTGQLEFKIISSFTETKTVPATYTRVLQQHTTSLMCQ